MSGISVSNLKKSFFVAERFPGFWGAFRGLFSRSHREVKALDGISFSISPGELVGFIGPNGAGKSTTLKILSGILVPDEGTCTVAGRTPWEERLEHVAGIGVVFGQRTQLWWDLPVIESFELLRDIYRVSQPQYQEELQRLSDLLGLAPLFSTPVRQLSLGQRMRCELAASLLHRPSLLFLDEPTIGLDAPSKLAVRAFIQTLNRDRKVTVILTTHDLDDIETLCERVIVINQGRTLFDGNLADLRRNIQPERRLRIDLEDPNVQVSDPDTTVISQEHGRVLLRFNPSLVSTPALISRLTQAYPIRDLFVENPPIEEIITRLVRQKLVMSPYLSLYATGFRRLLQYRLAALAGFATQLFWGLIRVMIFSAFFAFQKGPQPMTLAEVITYIWLGQGLLMLLPWSLDSEIQGMIRSGNLAYELTRPIDLHGQWFCRSLALRTAPMFLRAGPLLGLSFLFFGLQAPPSLASGLSWIIATCGAILLSASFTTIMNMTTLFTISGEGLARALPACVMVFSGLVIPLPLFPDSWQSFLALLPFRGIMDAPFRLYSGNLPPDALPAVLCHQVIWALLFLIGGRLILRFALRRLVIQGG